MKGAAHLSIKSGLNAIILQSLIQVNVQKLQKIWTQTVQKCNLVGKGHHVYLDNYYCSPELFSELHYLETFGASVQY